MRKDTKRWRDSANCGIFKNATVIDRRYRAQTAPRNRRPTGADEPVRPSEGRSVNGPYLILNAASRELHPPLLAREPFEEAEAEHEEDDVREPDEQLGMDLRV
jgi:hypothetical protein